MLILLGCFQSMGRAKADQHRGFINSLRQAEKNTDLWTYFTQNKGYNSPEKWIESLDTWFDEKTNQIRYSEWMHYFVSMYQINRYIHIYRKLFLDLPKIIISHDHIDINAHFSPRENPNYTSSGKRFDAPPIPLKVGKFWVIRELARLNFSGYRNEKVLQYCWMPTQSVLDWFGVCDSQRLFQFF